MKTRDFIISVIDCFDSILLRRMKYFDIVTDNLERFYKLFWKLFTCTRFLEPLYYLVGLVYIGRCLLRLSSIYRLRLSFHSKNLDHFSHSIVMMELHKDVRLLRSFNGILFSIFRWSLLESHKYSVDIRWRLLWGLIFTGQ